LIVVFDASVLVYLIDADAKAPLDPSTGKPLEQCKERIEHLLASLQQQGAKIVIPTTLHDSRSFWPDFAPWLDCRDRVSA